MTVIYFLVIQIRLDYRYLSLSHFNSSLMMYIYIILEEDYRELTRTITLYRTIALYRTITLYFSVLRYLTYF